MPCTYGDAVLAAEAIDYAIEADIPLASPHPSRATVSGQAIAARAAALVPDGATLQVGIGAMPDAVLDALSGHRGLRIWSDMFSDGVLALAKTGALDPGQPVIASFAFGTDFAVGALHSHGGLSVIALPSAHPRTGASTVVPRLTGPVTSSQHSFIVSDQGTAMIWGLDASSQAGQIITQVSHPSAREELRAAGRQLGFRV